MILSSVLVTYADKSVSYANKSAYAALDIHQISLQHYSLERKGRKLQVRARGV